MKKVRVLFVCLGNICRSPLGAAILKKKIRENGMDQWVEVDSCGTSNYHIGDGADPRTIANATENGVPIEHAARQLIAEDLRDFDYVFAMDKSNYQNIMSLATDPESVKDRVLMMRAFDPLSNGGEVPDPYHGGAKGFQEVFEILDRSTDGFIEHLEKSFKF